MIKTFRTILKTFALLMLVCLSLVACGFNNKKTIEHDADSLLDFLEEPFMLEGEGKIVYLGQTDDKYDVYKYNPTGEFLFCCPDIRTANKICLDQEGQKILGVNIGMSRKDANEKITNYSIELAMQNGNNYNTKSIINNKYELIVTWQMSDKEASDFENYCRYVGNSSSEIYREDHGGKTANEKLENFMKSNGLVGTAAKIEVSLTENASE